MVAVLGLVVVVVVGPLGEAAPLGVWLAYFRRRCTAESEFGSSGA